MQFHYASHRSGSLSLVCVHLSLSVNDGNQPQDSQNHFHNQHNHLLAHR
jgi:hypothetical protein